MGYASNKKSLIVVEMHRGNVNDHAYSYIVRYNFDKGECTSKDTLFHSYSVKNRYDKNWVSFDKRRNIISANRYIIGLHGDVFDLKEKSLTHRKKKNKHISKIIDSLNFSHRRPFYIEGKICESSDYDICYFDSKKKDKLKSKFYHPIENYSPDYKYVVNFPLSNLGFAITIQDLKGKTDTISYNAGAPNKLLPISSSFPIRPLKWLSDSTFIYTGYFMNDSSILQKENEYTVRVKAVNIRTKECRELFHLSTVAASLLNSTFIIDAVGRLYFSCPVGYYYIDVANNKFEEANYLDIGYGFKRIITDDDRKWIIEYNGEEIGREWGTTLSTEEYIVITDRFKTLKVWSTYKRKWITVDTSVSNIIGWVKN